MLGGMWPEFTDEWWERKKLTRREYLNQRIRSVAVSEKVGTGQSRQMEGRKCDGLSGLGSRSVYGWFSDRC